MYAICLRLTANVQTAEELTQEAFVRAWQRLSSFRGDSAFAHVAASSDRQCRARSAARATPVVPAPACHRRRDRRGCERTDPYRVERREARRQARPRVRHPQASACRTHRVRSARRRRLAARRNRRAHGHRRRHQQGASAPRTTASEGVAFAMNERDMNERDGANPQLDALIDALPRAIDPPRDLVAHHQCADCAARQRSRPWELARRQQSRAVTVARCSSAFRTTRSRACAAPRWAYEQLDSAYRAAAAGVAGTLSRRRRPVGSGAARHRRGESRDHRSMRCPKSVSALASRPRDAALGQMLQRTYEQELAIVDAVTPRQAADDRAGSITLSRCIVRALNVCEPS